MCKIDLWKQPVPIHFAAIWFDSKPYCTHSAGPQSWRARSLWPKILRRSRSSAATFTQYKVHHPYSSWAHMCRFHCFRSSLQVSKLKAMGWSGNDRKMSKKPKIPLIVGLSYYIILRGLFLDHPIYSHMWSLSFIIISQGHPGGCKEAEQMNTGKSIKDEPDKENKGKDKDKSNETVDETGEKVPKSKAKTKA